MQPKGAEPLASAPLGTAHPIAPSRSWTATRSRHGHCVAAWPFDDGTSLRFMILRRSWVSRFPGEHSLSLGTPGLHDESPLGFGLGRIGSVISTWVSFPAYFQHVIGFQGAAFALSSGESEIVNSPVGRCASNCLTSMFFHNDEQS